jgi:hypothetical protein
MQGTIRIIKHTTQMHEIEDLSITFDYPVTRSAFGEPNDVYFTRLDSETIYAFYVHIEGVLVFKDIGTLYPGTLSIHISNNLLTHGQLAGLCSVLESEHQMSLAIQELG